MRRKKCASLHRDIFCRHNQSWNCWQCQRFSTSNHIAAASVTNSIFSRRTTNGAVVQFRRDTTAVGNITVTTTSTSYGTSSDYRLKENVVDLDGAIDRVKQLTPKRFNFIADADTVVDGFLAHEAQVVVPEAVTGTKDDVDEEDNSRDARH